MADGDGNQPSLASLFGRLAFVASLLLLGLFAGYSPEASAHATLIASSPANNAVVDAVPSEIVLTFDEGARVSPDNGVVVLDPEGSEVQRGEAEPSSGETVITQRIEGDTEGTYTVSYRLISKDNHVVAGSYVFHVGKVTGSAESAASDYSTGWGIGALGRALFLAGALLGLGGMVVVLFVDGGSRGAGMKLGRRELAVLVGAAAGCAAGAALGLWGLSAELSNSLIPSVASIQDVLSATQPFGGPLLWLIAAVVAGLTTLAIWVMPKVASPAIAAVFLFLALVPAASGHDAARGGVAVLVDGAHMVSAAVWVGGLMFLLLTWGSRHDTHGRLYKFSGVALVAAMLTVVTGVLNSALLLDGLQNWLSTWSESTYTTVLSIKVALVVVILLLGFASRRSLRGKFAEPTDAAEPTDKGKPSMVLGVEGLLVVAVVALTSVLVGLVPPSQAASEEFQGVSQAGSITVRMQVFPAAAGVNEVHLYFLQLDGSLAEVDAAELAIASDLVESRRIPLTMINASHAIAPNVDLTPGMWLFDVTVVTANEGGASTEFTVEIK